jgi:hypothetical protein
METPPLPSPPPSYPPPVPREGMGCFGKGCLIAIVIGLFLVAVVGGGGWYLYSKAVNLFTASQPIDVRVEEPSDAVSQAAEQKLNRLRAATSNNEEATIGFSAADLNALIARDPGFRGARNRARIAIADSVVIVDLSAPLDSAPLPKLKGRWLNGTAHFGFSFAQGQFVFDAKSILANGHDVPQEFLGTIPSFTKSFNDSFRRGLQKNSQGSAFWGRIKTIGVEGDKLVITTQRG